MDILACEVEELLEQVLLHDKIISAPRELLSRYMALPHLSIQGHLTFAVTARVCITTCHAVQLYYVICHLVSHHVFTRNHALLSLDIKLTGHLLRNDRCRDIDISISCINNNWVTAT